MTLNMSFKVGQQVIRRVSDGPRLGVVQGVIRRGSVAIYYFRTRVGAVHCDPDRRLKPAQAPAGAGR